MTEQGLPDGDFYREAVDRMQKAGFTAEEIQAALDSMIRVTNLAIWAGM